MKTQSLIAAAGLFYASRVYSQDTIYSGTGFGTYYYDVEQLNACGNDFGPQNEGPVECSFSTALSLDQVNSQYLVAMNHSQLVGDIATYCGKRVIVSVNGVPSSLPLFIGDGCQRCGTGSSSSDSWDPNGAPGLDFSYSVLSELSSSACSDGHISISWEIVDETLYNFDTNAPGSPEGPVGDSGGNSPATTAAAADPTPASQATDPAPSPSVDSSAEDPAPTTLVTVLVIATSTVTPTVSTDLSIPASPTIDNASEPCATGAWQCNSNVLEQCLNDSWTPRFTCDTGLTCQGGSSPYCAP